MSKFLTAFAATVGEFEAMNLESMFNFGHLYTGEAEMNMLSEMVCACVQYDALIDIIESGEAKNEAEANQMVVARAIAQRKCDEIIEQSAAIYTLWFDNADPSVFWNAMAN